MKLKSLHAREVLDSRGNPTVEVVAKSASFSASAIVPSGASTGSHEALELRDSESKRYFGKGVQKAVLHVNTVIAKKMRGCDFGKQRKLDDMLIALDGTENKSLLGANAILGVSLACAKLAAAEAGVPFFQYLNKKARTLPVPMMNIINGGVHANSGLEFQEMMIVPAGFSAFHEALRAGAEIFHALKKLLAEKGLQTTVGDEGGFAPLLASHEQGLDLIVKAIENAHYRPGRDVYLALDAASTEFYKKGVYTLTVAGKKKKLGAAELIAYYEKLAAHYPFVSIEDGCSEDDWEGWQWLTKKLGGSLQLVGDDLFVTNLKRLAFGVKHEAANSILIKLNQIGTLTETLDVIVAARDAGYSSVISHRSGESEDTTIAHLAVGMETGQIKTGSLSRTDRVAKYNELLRIEETLGARAVYPGEKIFAARRPK